MTTASGGKNLLQCVGGIPNSLGDGFWRNQPQLESICCHFSMEGFMRSVRSGYVFTALVAIGAILMLPVCGHAQDSTVSGTVTDPSGAVIPGVTMTATHTESGNKFEAVTDERGGYRLLVRVGNYRITAGWLASGQRIGISRCLSGRRLS